jgi:hypothetical protein
MTLERLYDEIAKEYDKEYQQEKWQQDEIQTAKHLRLLQPYGNVLSLGCGTGQDIVIGDFKNDQFTGIDNSVNMLKCALEKFPGYKFAKWDCSETFDVRADTVVSLFGTINYVGLESFIDQIIKSKATSFFGVMFSPRYKPSLGSEFCTYYTLPQIEQLFTNNGFACKVLGLFDDIDFADNDYWVISSR